MEHALHGFTVISIFFAVLGFLYVSDILLSGREKVFRWVIRVIGPGLVVALPSMLIGLILLFLHPSVSLGPFSLNDLVDNFVIYSGLIGIFHGLFSHSSGPPSQTNKLLRSWHKLPLFARDGITGFIIASFYWPITTFIVFNTQYYDPVVLLSDYFSFTMVGAFGGIFWRSIHQALPEVGNRIKPFNRRDCFLGMICWLVICILIYTAAFIFYNVRGIIHVSDSTLLETCVLILLGGITSGFSRFIAWQGMKISSDTLNTLPLFSSPFLLQGGFIGSSYRLVRKLSKVSIHGKVNPSIQDDIARLAFWLTSWLLIGIVLFLIILILERWRIFDSSSTPLNLLVFTLVGTAMTLLAGAIVVGLLQLLSWVISSIRRSLTSKSANITTLEQQRSVFEEVEAETRSLSSQFFLFLRDYCFQLVFWYELWFVFAACTIVYASFPSIGIPLIVCIGTITTLVSGGIFKLILWQPNHSQASDGSAAPIHPLAFLLCWPIMWLGTWIINVTVFWDSGPDSLILPRSIPIGSAITVCIGLLVAVLFRLLPLSILYKRQATSGQQPLSQINQKQKLFSPRQSFLDSMFWLWAWFILGIIVPYSFFSIDDVFILGHSPFNRHIIFDSGFLLSWTWILAVVLAGAIVGGFSPLILRWTNKQEQPQVANGGMHKQEQLQVIDEDRRRLVTIGICLTIVAFLMQLVEPTTQLLQTHVRGHTDAVLTVAWSPDGTRIASAGDDGAVQVWDFAGGDVQVHKSFLNSVYALAWSPDGKFIASSSYDMSSQIWDAETGSRIDDATNDTTPVYAVAWRPLKDTHKPHENQVAFTGDNGTVELWKEQGHTWFQLTLPNPTTIVRDVAWSPDGSLLAVANEDGTVGIWDMRQNAYINIYHIHNDKIYTVSWSPDGKYIASASEDKTMKVWKATTGSIVQVYEHTAAVDDVSWSWDGKRLASACGDGTVQIWTAQDFKDHKPLLVYRGHTGPVNALKWAPHDLYIASASSDKTVRIWDPITGDTVLTYGPGTSQ